MKSSLFLLLIIFNLVACSNAPLDGDRKLSRHDIPSFLEVYTKDPYEKAEFYEKSKKKKDKAYEVKYLENGQEVSLAFDRDGKLVEKEMDLEFNQLTSTQQTRILNYLKKEYPGYVLLEVEKRTEHEKENFIDVEIRHSSSKSGYWEVSFDEQGNFKNREIEVHQQIETLN